MATLTIQDLQASDVIDYKAVACVRGGAAGAWVFAISPVREGSQLSPSINYYETNNFNNFFIADQLNIQVQNIAVDTAADTAVVNVIAGQDSAAVKLGG